MLRCVRAKLKRETKTNYISLTTQQKENKAVFQKTDFSKTKLQEPVSLVFLEGPVDDG